MTTEVSITINNLGYVTCRHVNLANTNATEIPLDHIRKSPPIYLFVFQDPSELQKVFESTTSESTEKRNGIRKLRLKILYTISFVQLTPEERNGGIDRPNLSMLVQTWRSACRAIPRDHEIQEIIFDMSCEQQVGIRQMLARLLQHIVNTLCLRARGAIHCQVKGCGNEKKVLLENSMVGV
ncbi:hypothetical protein BDV29DRAFT_198590 [Aspergillus leporis]|uniref:Uncharacterized protein n=1 Tax=Aspergillus leporis TaxID=41062 RepID=A0A5N5WR56_9EURO|nr:hypothetical protein BDV29DRAFT_198590 [Aspergillus leporis]